MVSLMETDSSFQLGQKRVSLKLVQQEHPYLIGWNPGPNKPGAPVSLAGVTYGNGLFVAVSEVEQSLPQRMESLTQRYSGRGEN